MSGYGGKEKWILPMGTLSAEYEDRFTAFIDLICVNPGGTGPRQHAQYSGPGLVKSRLDTLSQEGIPTLPYLIDQPREYAGLVKLWNRQCTPPTLANALTHHPIEIGKLSESVRQFHSICTALNEKTVGLIETAVERDEEDLSDSEVIEEEVTSGFAEMSLGQSPQGSIGSPQGSMRLQKKEVYRKTSFNDDEYSSSPPKRGLDSVWPGLFRKRPDRG